MKEVVSFRVGEKGETDIGSGHNWIWMDITGAIGGKEKKRGRGRWKINERTYLGGIRRAY